METRRRFGRIKTIGSVVFVLALVLTTAYAAPTFTGFAPTDFTDPGVIYYADVGGIGDVGLPTSAPAGTISGWDMAGVYLEYDAGSDTLYVGVDCGGPGGPAIICGDADGDGNPGGSSAWLTALSGVDTPDLSVTESMCMLIDTNLDDNAEVAVGVNDDSTLAEFAAYNRAPAGFSSPPLAFLWGFPLSNVVSYYASPNSSAPDLEFSIEDFSTLPNFTFTPGEEFCFNTLIYAGSQEDDGIGEDSIGPTQICFDSTTAVDLISFTAIPGQQAIDVAWETATETDNLGFNLYRAESSAGPWTQLNEALIPGQAPGSPVGGTYAFADSTARRGITYYYRLEDVSLAGAGTFHGPISAELPAPWIDLLRPRLKPAPIVKTP